MRWARVAVVLGALVVCGAFALGTQVSPSVSAGGETWTCATAIPSGWLVAGTPSGAGTGGATALERRLDAACGVKVDHLRWALGGLFGLGGVTLLIGWTALRERELGPRPDPAYSRS